MYWMQWNHPPPASRTIECSNLKLVSFTWVRVHIRIHGVCFAPNYAAHLPPLLGLKHGNSW